MILKHRILVGLLTLALFATLSSVGATPERTVGLFVNEEGTSDGYTLFTPLQYGTTYLIDNEGRLVHSWETGLEGLALTGYLQEDGSVLGPAGGGARRVAWDGTVLWEYSGQSTHHDIEVLPNGNVLMIGLQVIAEVDAIAAGRDPALLSEGELWPDFIIEVEPTGPTSGNIVWEWYAWDHLIQDYDPMAANFGVVGDHPELIDLNYSDSIRPAGEADWHHSNAIDYNEELDQIMLSVRHFSELWVIDHSTTTAESAGHSGGNNNKGGDLLYRWGNPQAYDAGGAQDQKLFLQHDTQWIDPGLPGAGNILVFNNGNGRPGGNASSADELVPPVDGVGVYSLTPGQAFGPADLLWTYQAPNPADFYSFFISGAQRLPNGNTLIDAGAQGTFFEVTPEGETVWTYVSPVNINGVLAQGDPPAGNFVFRAHRYAPDHPGLAGRDLTPGVMIEISDSDKDGLTDQDEFHIHGTDPLLADTDADGLTDGAELGTHLTDPLVADTDEDGCMDGLELGDTAGAGGLRSPLYYWDFVDQWRGGGKDQVIVVGDIGAVVVRFGTARGATPTKQEALDEALIPPASPTGYHASADRSALIGPNPWNAGPPDGSIVVGDIGAVVAQFGHSCAGAP